MRALWRGIRDATKKADILAVSHYHFDRHNPDAPSIYKGIVRTTAVRTLIVDHHALRDREWRTQLETVLRAGEEHGVAIRTAAEFAGKAVDQLANRDVLHGLPPAGPDLPPQES